MPELMLTPQRRMKPLLGTFVEVAAVGEQAREAIERAFSVMASLQQKLSFQQTDSELSRLNAAGGHWCYLSPLSLRVLRAAKAMTQASDHHFNCTLGGALIVRGKLPDHGGPFIEVGCAEDIEMDAERVRLRRPIRVTLDGIAKGFAVDRAIGELKRAGVAGGWVNAGGDLRVFGAIQLPVSRRCADGSLAALGGLRNAALASSQVGSAEGLAGFVVTGSGDDCAQTSVFSVVSRYAWRADALTKVAASVPSAQRAATVKSLGGWLLSDATGETQQCG